MKKGFCSFFKTVALFAKQFILCESSKRIVLLFNTSGTSCKYMQIAVDYFLDDMMFAYCLVENIGAEANI